MEIEVRTMLGQAIDVFKEYIKTKGNLEIDYHLEDYMQVIINYINVLELENERLKDKLECTIGIVEHNKIISEKNKEIHQLKDNWNKLIKWIVYNKHNENTEQHYLVVDYGTLLGKMIKLKQGSDSNE